MFTDMKGFTTKAATQSRQQLQHLLEMQDEIIKPAIKHYDGTIVKTIGDAFLVTFESPTDAVLCGMKIQENILNHNARATSTDQMEVRIAVNSGEVNIKDDDVFGEPVNIASRIEAIAEPNEVYFTEAVYLTMNKNEIPTAEVGHRKLKGIPEEIKVYKVMSEQTNLIRAKLKREQLAMANANLAKDEVNTSEKFKTDTAPEIKEKIINLEKEDAKETARESLMPEPKIKKSFWQKHKKKIIIIAFIFLFLLLITIAKEKERLQQEIVETKYPVEQLKEKLPELKSDIINALESRDPDEVKEMISRLKIISQDLPDNLKDDFRGLIEGQLDNPNLKPAQRQELKNIINSLK
jgi:class 3 adenylate cyclase